MSRYKLSVCLELRNQSSFGAASMPHTSAVFLAELLSRGDRGDTVTHTHRVCRPALVPCCVCVECARVPAALAR